MKKREIVWTHFAAKCLNEIHAYIFEETKSEAIANKYCLKLLNSVEHLSLQANAGTIEPLLKKVNQNSRFIIEGNYKIIYQYDDETLFNTDVFHTKQNPKKIITRNRKRN
jgi:hypothetical protein